MPQSLKRFLSNFNVVAIQNSLDGFSNTLYVRNNSKTIAGSPVVVETYFLSSAFESSEDGRQSALKDKIVTMAVCFLTPIDTSSEKRPLISDHIKRPQRLDHP